MVPKQVTTYYAQSDIDIIRMYKKIGFVNNIGKHLSDLCTKMNAYSKRNTLQRSFCKVITAFDR